ncbi:MAG: class I SAM-dependent methyltransferase [Terracidiphilus sp.]|jgi:SAM-dependent methyltransferase
MPTKIVETAVRPVARRLMPRPVRLWAKDMLNARRVERNPGRMALVDEILPAYAACGGRILWIGCRRYTKKYGSLLEKNGGQCWTVDIESAHAKWGEKGRHFTWDLLSIDRLLAAASFDTVLCNGVFGFGVDARPAQLTALQAMRNILKPGGRLLLGWNTDRVEDPLSFDFVRSAFVGDDLTAHGARWAVPAAGYVYEFLRRRE